MRLGDSLMIGLSGQLRTSCTLQWFQEQNNCCRNSQIAYRGETAVYNTEVILHFKVT